MLWSTSPPKFAISDSFVPPSTLTPQQQGCGSATVPTLSTTKASRQIKETLRQSIDMPEPKDEPPPKFKVGDIAVFVVCVGGRCTDDDPPLWSVVMDIKEVTWVAESGSWHCGGKILDNTFYATVPESELEKPKYLPGQKVRIEYDGADVKGTIRGVWLDEQDYVGYDIEASLQVPEHHIKEL